MEGKSDVFKIRLYKYTIKLLRFLVKIPYDSVVNEIKKQATRSGTSIGANFFEARGAGSKLDYKRFFTYSLKSANETRYWLSILIDAGLIANEQKVECKLLLEETDELAKILASSIITMQKNNN